MPYDNHMTFVFLQSSNLNELRRKTSYVQVKIL